MGKMEKMLKMAETAKIEKNMGIDKKGDNT